MKIIVEDKIIENFFGDKKMEKQILKLKLEKGVKIPEYKTEYASGFDIAAYETVVIPKGKRRIIKTGIKANIPIGYEIQIRPRSGLAARDGITVLNTPGTIDSDYTGEWMVIMYNASDYDFRVKKGMRIAQAVLQYVPKAEIVIVDELKKETERGEGGLGSTGI